MKKSNKILIFLTFLLTVCIGGFFIYTLDFYSADYRHNNYYDLQLNIQIKKDLHQQVLFHICYLFINFHMYSHGKQLIFLWIQYIDKKLSVITTKVF